MTKKHKKILLVIGYCVLAIIAFLYVFPIIIVLLNSFKTSSEIRTSGLGFPENIYLGNYITAWEAGNFGKAMINSIVITGLSLVFIYFLNVLSAYPFARMKFTGKGALYMIFLSGIMFPIQMAIIPLFKIITNLGLVNNPLGLVFVYTAFSMPMGILIISNFIRAMPIELEEAASIDGCGTVRLLYQIILPIVKPAVATVLIINAISIWNDLLLPIIVLTTKDAKTMPAGLMYFSGQYSTQWEYVTAAVMIISAPMVIFYLFMQKHIVNGLAAGAVKS
ncbi:MAG: carbohydrate ABC transporter permease [Eubacteriales bacterium]